MSEKQVILLRTGWDTINIGDIGHTPGTLRVLEQHLPNVRVVAWIHQLNAKIRAMLERRFPDVSIVEGDLDSDAEPTTPNLAQALESADLVVHNSSMSLDRKMMQAARKRGIPYGMFGQSYFPDVAANQELLALLSQASFVFCRETLTLRTLQQANVASPVLAFNPDGCFGIDVRDDTAAETFLAEHGLEDRRFVTIQLRTNTQKHPGTDSRLNPANPSLAQKADDERRATILRELITGWVERTGFKVLIAPEVEKEIAHNKRLLMDPLPERVREHVVVREQFWNVDEAASVFARARAVVCHEPHSCIIAMANGTPVLHTYSPFHSPKYHMFADIGIPEWLLPIDELPASHLLDALLHIHTDHEGARAKVRQAMGEVHAHLATACRTIGRALNGA